MLNYQRVDGLPNLIAWLIFPWRTVSHNQVGYFFCGLSKIDYGDDGDDDDDDDDGGDDDGDFYVY